ncbi:MAG: carboxylating nicotinate-nucleotide diphosphorylase [Candidatus Omnitrophica bacterium]|nr:carboxylating nicotinate-nucleotide diphosphorylase [Candidatus Omnitrophota bacterium]
MNITPDIKMLIKNALLEDSSDNDLTTKGLNISGADIKAVVVAKQEGVLCGLDVLREVFKAAGSVAIKTCLKDGMRFKKNSNIAYLKGKARPIISAERVAINFLSQLSGIATFTGKFVNVVSANKIKIYDTRKTTPTLRRLQKYAVKTGGGYNHRFNLSDSLMIKDNHIEIFKKKYGKDDYMLAMIKMLRNKYPRKELIVEVHNLSEWMQVVKTRPDVVMFDNWSAEDIEVALKMLKNKKFEIEISGSIKLEQLERIIELGVDRVSLGRITHSAPAIDFSLEIC